MGGGGVLNESSNGKCHHEDHIASGVLFHGKNLRILSSKPKGYQARLWTEVQAF